MSLIAKPTHRASRLLALASRLGNEELTAPISQAVEMQTRILSTELGLKLGKVEVTKLFGQ
jgi:hypothetical protein